MRTACLALLALSLAAMAGCWGSAGSPPDEGGGAPAREEPPVPSAGPPGEPDLSPAGREALQTLLKAEMFSTASVGIAGIAPPAVIALRTLWKEPEATAAFHHVIRKGTLPGQLFALCGLHDSAPEVFRAEIESYRRREERIDFMSGCILSPVAVSELVENPSAVRLGKGGTLRRWAEEHPGREIHFDIAGGGFPALFREAQQR